VALKLILLGGRVGESELRALDVIKGIRHAHLLATFGAWQVADRLIIAVELADKTLLDRLRESVAEGRPGIPAAELLEYMREAAKGIDYLNDNQHSWAGRAHPGIQHRDIKPQNLLLVGGTVKVADFGLARVLEGSLATHSGGFTPAYAAPEFFERHATPWSDQYSLAVTYCQLRGGRLPFTGNPAALMAGHLSKEPDLTMLPKEERAAVSRALAKDPEKRWPSCQEFATALGTPHSPFESASSGPSQVLPTTVQHLGPDTPTSDTERGQPKGTRQQSSGDSRPAWMKLSVRVLLIALGVGLLVFVSSWATGFPFIPTRTIPISKSAESGGLTLRVDKIEEGLSNFRVHMTATNGTRDKLGLPLFGYFNVVDELGNQYEADPFSSTFPHDVAPGATISGYANMKTSLNSKATTVTITFTTVFGSFQVRSITVEGVPLRK
jgi:serine/threonine protein kinase